MSKSSTPKLTDGVATFPPFEKRGDKSDNECTAFLLKFYQDRCSRPQNGASFEERVAVLGDYGLGPIESVLTRFLMTKMIEPVKSPFTNRLYTTLYTVVFTPHGDEKPMVAAEKAYNFVKTNLKVFIQEKIRPSMEDISADLTAQAGVCWTAYDVLGRVLKFFFKTKSDNYSRALKLPDLDNLISSICYDDFFGSIKEKLTAKLCQEIKDLRHSDWERNSSSSCVFYDDDRYGYLNKTIDLFIKVDDMRKLGIKTYKECIESAILSDLRTYYGSICKTWAVSLPTHSITLSETYINQVYTALTIERMRSDRCLHASSLACVDTTLVQLFLGDYLRSNKPFFQEIYGDLFSYEKHVREESGFCSDIQRATATKLFDMLVILDKCDSTTYVAQVAKILSISISRDFDRLTDEFSSINLADKVISKDLKDKMLSFFSQFFTVYNSYQDVAKKIFNNNPHTDKAASDVYAKVMNSSIFNKTFSDALSVYVDCNLCKGKQKSIIYESTDKFLKNAVDLTHYVDDKLSLFDSFKDDLFYRITEENVEDYDKERTFQSTFSSKFGIKQVTKLARLLNSVADSLELNKTLMDYDSSSSPTQILEMVPMVLDSGVVVKQKNIELAEAPCSAPFLRSFERLGKLYNQTHNTKKLVAIYALGTCHVSCVFYQKGRSSSHLAVMGVLQALVLTAFHRDKCEKYKDADGYMNLDAIEALTGIAALSSESMTKDLAEQKQVLKKILGSLIRAKLIAQKSENDVDGGDPGSSSSPRSADPGSSSLASSPRGGDAVTPSGNAPQKIKDDSQFKACADYKNTQKRFVLPSVKFEFQEKQIAHDEISTNIDACVVRIMKARKRLKAVELTSEVCAQMASCYRVSDITILKKRYESLIEREYMKRDDDDPQYFIYT